MTDVKVNVDNAHDWPAIQHRHHCPRTGQFYWHAHTLANVFVHNEGGNQRHIYREDIVNLVPHRHLGVMPDGCVSG